jgi:pimeloyl-ACP methyl ester carboxylesterase
MHRATWILRTLAVAACAITVVGPAASEDRIGIVLMHGNFSWGGQFEYVGSVVRDAGFGLETPDMCWSDTRTYDRTAVDCMDEVDAAFDRLEAAGYDRIVVAGHSMGGVNALLYAASHNDLAGIIVFAPSRGARNISENPRVVQAMQLVKAGRGDETVHFARGFDGFDSTPRALLSYEGPDSPLNDVELLPRLTAPLLWVAGTADNGQRDAADRFALAPATPLSRLVWVESNHAFTPDIGVGQMVAWLDDLAASLAD